MSRAMDWLCDKAEEWRTAVVVTDRRSLLDGIRVAGGDLGELRDKLTEDNKTVTLVWVPSHCGLPGKEEADRLAGLGSELDQTGALVTGAARRAQLRKRIAGEPVRHERLREVYRGNIGRSTTDQCLRLSQQISDGFQAKPPHRTLLTLFDYSRAFFTVRRSALLTKMVDKQVPEAFVEWTRRWLTNRIGRVRIENTIGRERVMREGVTQGAELSPLLFITFLDDMWDRFEDDTMVSAYADDLALAMTDSNKEDLENRMQGEVDKLAEAEWFES